MKQLTKHAIVGVITEAVFSAVIYYATREFLPLPIQALLFTGGFVGSALGDLVTGRGER